MFTTAQPFVFVDIETTGLSARTGGRVLEVGAIRVEEGKVVSEFKQLLHPESRVPYFITQMTGICDDDVKDSPLFCDIAQDLQHFFKDALFIAHNVNFDYRFIQNEFTMLGQTFNKQRLCTVRLSRALFPEHKSHKLDHIIERFGFDVQNRHRAYDDAEILYKFLMHLQQTNTTNLETTFNKLIIKTP